MAIVATAITSDCAIVDTLTNTFGKLSVELESANANLVSSLLKNQKLLKLISHHSKASRDRGDTSRGGVKIVLSKSPWTGPPMYYCHTHGLQYTHSSFKCPTLGVSRIKILPERIL